MNAQNARTAVPSKLAINPKAATESVPQTPQRAHRRIMNLSRTLNITAFCRDVYTLLSCVPVVDVASWEANPYPKKAPAADLEQWDKINAIWETVYLKYIDSDNDRMNDVMRELWDNLHELIEVDYETARNDARGFEDPAERMAF